MLVWTWAGLACADVIHLKNGDTLEGDIIRTDDREVVINVPQVGEMTLQREEIASIDHAPIPNTPPKPEASSGDVQAYVSWQDVSDQATRLYERRQFKVAEEKAKQAMQMAEAFFGPAHSEVARAAGLVGSTLREQGKYAEAEPFFSLALRIWDGMEGSHQPTVASALQDLADVYVLQGKYAQAEPLLYKAVTIRENLPHPEDADLARALDQYVEVLTRLGHEELARQMAARAHEIRSTQ